MRLSKYDLEQFDEVYLRSLPEERLQALSVKLLADLKEAHDRLNQTPLTSSRPPSTRAPWECERDGPEGDETEAVGPPPVEPPEAEVADPAEAVGSQRARRPGARRGAPAGRPGRAKGAPGVSRTQQFPVDSEQIHRPERCVGCGAPLHEGHEQRTYTARYELDVVPPGEGRKGFVRHQTKHLHREVRCGCGHWTRAKLGRGPAETEWTVALTEWHLAGPMLVALICSLALRLRLSRARIQEFLHDWLGLALSVATINQCLHEAGRAVAPVVQDELVQAVREAQLLHADETGWKPWGQPVWLWVMTCATATLFVVGRRTREVVQCILGETFGGWLMSDGYAAYRDYTWRLRCLAHIERKARGLKDSLERQARSFGSQVLTVIEPVMAAVYQARSSPPQVPLRTQHANSLHALFVACVQSAESAHEKTRQLARELLNYWDTLWVVLDHPELPLTNHEAERALQHWVIARRISQGTRTAQGTRAFANLASIIDTCRKRSASPWPYLAEVLRQRRKGLPAPSLPAPTP